MRAHPILALVLWLIPLAGFAADLCASDALDRRVCLPDPARRVVSLSPGTTELLFSAGAGASVLAVSAWSDYPPAARELPRVGDSTRLDLEAIVALQPDLVVAWTDGNSRAQLDRISALGIPVFWLAPRQFQAIASAVETLGILTGHASLARQRAALFQRELDGLRARFGDTPPIRVFYQVWDEPLMTVSGEELISKAIALCGGVNVFADSPRLVPRVSREAVIAADPQAILTAGRGGDGLASWRAFPGLAAVERGNLFALTPDLLQRPTLRMLDGTRELCQTLETARDRL